MISVALPFHAGDCDSAIELLRWIGALSNVKRFPAVLVADAGTPFDKAIEAKELAGAAFSMCDLVVPPKSVHGWIAGANHLWKAAMRYGYERSTPILWLEPDAIPLKPTWLDALDAAYSQIGEAHMGAIEECRQVGLPQKMMSGVAIYGQEMAQWLNGPDMPRPFNVDYASLIVPHAAHTPLIRDFFGQKDLPPTFVEHEYPEAPAHHFSLDWLPADAVLFHRDKSHSLIPLLAKRLGIPWSKPKQNTEKIVVVFPVHRGDIALACHHALWLRKLNRKWDHEAVITADANTPRASLETFRLMIAPCFSRVNSFTYQSPPVPTYPASANWAWQSTAFHMTNQNSPWLWMEADAVVLRPDWLERLQEEYERGGKPWMGSVVEHLGHTNGTAVYPFDAARRMPAAMSCGPATAFDMAARTDMEGHVHDASHLMHHVWTVLHGRLHPVGGGSAPMNATPQLLSQIPKSAVITHRWKDKSVIDLLLTGKYQHA